MSEETEQAEEKRKPAEPSDGMAAATAAGVAAGPAGGLATFRSAYARARSLMERPRWGGLLVLGVIALALVAAFFLIPWRGLDSTATREQATADRLAALEASTAALEGELDSYARRLSALERAYEELAAGGAALSEMGPLSDRVAGLIAAMEDLSARVDALETRAPEAGGAGSPQPAGLSDLRARQSQIESALSALEAALKGRIDALEARLGNELVNRITAVEQAQASAPSRADIEGLGARMTLLETNEGIAALRRATRVLAVSALSQAVRSEAPYSAEIALVADYVGESPALVALKAYAEKGVASKAALEREFAEAARAARAAGAGGTPEGGEASFFARAWRAVMSLVTVRRTDAEAAGDLEAVLARAQSALARGDVAAAAREARAVGGPPRTALEPWLARAEEHIEAEKALRALQVAALSGFTQN